MDITKIVVLMMLCAPMLAEAQTLTFTDHESLGNIRTWSGCSSSSSSILMLFETSRRVSSSARPASATRRNTPSHTRILKNCTN